jgi:prevent-host-death family protein
MRRWQLQDAKARLSEVVKACEAEGPQEISVRGKPTAVLLSKRDHERLVRRGTSFVEFLRDSPLVGVQWSQDRDRSPARRVRL